MNINLSGRQLQRPDIVERVRQTIERTGVDPGSIKLEITESVMMKDMEVSIERLHGLKKIGVKLAMDDFGTGYSCMANLDALPLDTVKIDRSFIQRLATMKEGSDQMVAAIIALSRALNLDVTGEGVETLRQVTQLKGLGCEIAQGYFFARPLDAETLGSYILAGPGSLARMCEEIGEPDQVSLDHAA
jgi:EAL domain-containing protein (putative c-di-GMP-specific phosphodiesterase class I)